jgi:branched-subunit amino acid ABC-type transport system permease component
LRVLISSLGFGVVTAALVAIPAVAFTLQFSVTNILNLALGATMTLDGFAAYVVNRAGLNIWLALVVAGVVGAVFSVIVNLLVFSPFARHGTKLTGMVIVTLAVGIILGNLLQGVVGGSNFFSYSWNIGSTITFGDLALTATQLITVGIAVVAMGLVHVVLRYTTMGKAMRAIATSVPLAKACGIRVQLVANLAWAISGALAGIGAVLFFMDTSSFSATTTNGFFIVIIAAAVLGGIGHAYGAMLGALIVGLSTEVAAALINPALKDVVAFVLLALVLLIRPRGIVSEVSNEKAIAA